MSTDSQDLEKNKAAIVLLANDLGLGQVHWVEETASGKISWRDRKIFNIIEHAAPGDTLIVSELSRLGRTMLEIMEILSVATHKGLNIYAVKGNWKLDGSLQSRVVAMAFAIAAEIERDLISSRTKEALAAKKRAGQRLGRPSGAGKSKLDAHALAIRQLLANGSTLNFIAKKYGTTRSNLHRWMKAHGIERTA
jgi:DNA invertase Pin-like site-specific DNA recombinase